MCHPWVAALILVGAALSGCDEMGSYPVDARAGDAGFVPDGQLDVWVEPLRLNHIQVRGTVNSYIDSPFDVDPQWDYSHLPLDEQAAVQGIRQFDFDLTGDGHALTVREAPATNGTLCDAFFSCLEDLAAYSDAHPQHPPLVILLGETWFQPNDTPDPFFWHVDEIEDYLVRALGRDRMLSPDDVRGGHPDLSTAIEVDGWPTVDETRGKIIAVLNEHGEARARYLERGGLDPADRFMWQVGDPAEPSPDEVIFSFEAVEDAQTLAAIGALVRTGRLVHASTEAAAMVPRLQAAGAHMIATRRPDEVFGPPGERPSRCNPVTAPPDCQAERIEPPLNAD